MSHGASLSVTHDPSVCVLRRHLPSFAGEEMTILGHSLCSARHRAADGADVGPG